MTYWKNRAIIKIRIAAQGGRKTMHTAYIKECPGATRAVMMIHGICSTPRHFDWLIDLFDEGWSVYNILLDGHGGSVQDFSRTSMKKWKAQTCSMLEQLSEKYESVLLIGYSLGTLLQIHALPAFPKVKGMLLLNTPMCPAVSFRMVKYSMTMLWGKVNENSCHGYACSRDVSIRLSKNPFLYLGWLPRFAELLQLCAYGRKHGGDIRVPCYAYFGGRDELVSLRSKKYLEENPNVTVRIFDTAGHFWFSPEDKNTVRQDLKDLLFRL